ncbi:MAG: CHAT domain-containing protein [bacterium]
MKTIFKTNSLSGIIFPTVIFITLLFSSAASQISDNNSILSTQYRKSLLLIGSKQYEQAIHLLKKHIENNPSMARAYLKLAQVYNKKNELNTALHYFNILNQADPENPFVMYTIAWIYLNQGNYDQAVKYSYMAISLNSNYPEGFKNYVIAMDKVGNNDEALKFINKTIEMNLENAAAYYALGYLYQLQGNWDLALHNLDKALELRPDLLDAYNNKGVIYFNKSDYRKLLEISQYALDLAEKQKDLEFQCNLLGNIGLAFSYLGNSSEAIKYNKKSLEIARKIGYEKEYGRMLGNIGSIYMNISELDSALMYLHKAVEKMREIKNERLEGSYLRYLGAVFYMKNNYKTALRYFDKALHVIEKIGDQRGKSLVLWNQGLIYWNYGNFAESLEKCKEGLDIALNLDFKWAEERILTTMGLDYWNMGNYTKALDCQKKALSISREIGDKVGMNLQIGNLAILYGELGEIDKALDYYNQALALSRETGNKVDVATHFNNIGTIYAFRGDYNKALELFNQAVVISKQVQDKKSESIFLGNIGDVYISLDDYNKAENSIREAMKIAQDLGNQAIIASIHVKLGDLHMNMEQYTAAFHHFSESLKIAKSINQHVDIMEASMGLSVSCFQQNNFKKSFFYAEQAIKQFEEMRSTVSTEKFKTGFLVHNIDVYDQAIDVCSALHVKYPEEKYDSRSFYIAEKAKARSLLDIMYQGKIFQNLSEIPDSIQQELITCEYDIEKKYQELSYELNKSLEAQDKLFIIKSEEQLEDLKRKKEKILDYLGKKFPHYYTLTNPVIYTINDVQQKLLNEKQVLIEYFVGDEGIFMWIITKTEQEFITINISKSDLGNRLAAVSPIFNKQKQVIETKVDHRWANIRLDLLNQLYKDLLKTPAAACLDNTQELIIVPDDILHYFPFEILVTDLQEGEVTYLIEDYAISYAPSASLLNPDLRTKNRARHSLLAMGNPDFRSEKKKSFWDQLVGIVKYRAVFRGDNFLPLPEAEKEVIKIAENFRNSTVYTGKQANEERFKQIASDFNIIHLATHFLVDDSQPMYSKIVLSQAGNESEDGLLQTYEIYNMKLNADMVVLSGCNTGMGELKRGEGLMGITRAFLYAGVPSLVVSLWPVEDRSTAVLMDTFYQYLNKGSSENRALQKAKIDLIKSSDIKQDAFYWAPFVLIGR